MTAQQLNIAVIGSGISGLSSAYGLLRNRNDEHAKHAHGADFPALNIDVYEASPRLGGHTHTHELDIDGKNMAVDSGFIVLNDRNYPKFTDFLADLEVEVFDTSMSFAVSMAKSAEKKPYLEYAGSNLSTLCGGGKLALSPRHWGLLLGIMRFNRLAKADLQKGMSENQSLEQYLNSYGISQDVIHRYLLPMAAAIWSCPTEQIKAFPAKTFLTFFNHHGLLNISDRPQWKTVKGGSQRYIDALLKKDLFKVHTNHPLVSAIAQEQGVILEFANGHTAKADAVIFAGHSDEMFATFDETMRQQFSALSQVRYGANQAYLHTDEAFLPRNKSLWSCWNYLSRGEDDKSAPLMVSYWMNELQNLDTNKPLIVTLNPTHEPKPELVHKVMNYTHPIFDLAAIQAQPKIQSYQGQSNCYFAGAYLGYGFHEDGLASGYKASQCLIKDINAGAFNKG